MLISRVKLFSFLSLVLVIAIHLFLSSSHAGIALKKKTLPVSFHESNGWFEISDQKWGEMKSLHFETQKNQEPMNFLAKGNEYINFNWFESFSCPVPMIRIGMGDGGKIICDPSRLQRNDCLVYSIGSNGNFGFEKEIKKSPKKKNVKLQTN